MVGIGQLVYLGIVQVIAPQGYDVAVLVVATNAHIEPRGQVKRTCSLDTIVGSHNSIERIVGIGIASGLIATYIIGRFPNGLTYVTIVERIIGCIQFLCVVIDLESKQLGS